MSTANRLSSPPQHPAALAGADGTMAGRWPMAYAPQAPGLLARLCAAAILCRDVMLGRSGTARGRISLPTMSAEWLQERNARNRES
jgi:hypothetical protein